MRQPSDTSTASQAHSEDEMQHWLQKRTTEVWQRRVTVACWGHQLLTSRYRSFARAMNVLIVSLNAIIGSAVFTSLADSQASYPLRCFAGVISMVVAVIAAVKSELNFDGLHEQHRVRAHHLLLLDRHRGPAHEQHRPRTHTRSDFELSTLSALVRVCACSLRIAGTIGSSRS